MHYAYVKFNWQERNAFSGTFPTSKAAAPQKLELPNSLKTIISYHGSSGSLSGLRLFLPNASCSLSQRETWSFGIFLRRWVVAPSSNSTTSWRIW